MTLAVKASLRLEYGSDPAGTARRLGCSEHQAELFRDLPWKAIDRYAEGLVAKRWQEVRRALLLTLRVCPSLQSHYRFWVRAHPAAARRGVLAPGPREALRAMDALCCAVAADGANPDYAACLLQFEVMGRCSSQDGELRTLRSRYAVHELVISLRGGVIPFDPETSPTWYQFGRRVEWRPA